MADMKILYLSLDFFHALTFVMEILIGVWSDHVAQEGLLSPLLQEQKPKLSDTFTEAKTILDS